MYVYVDLYIFTVWYTVYGNLKGKARRNYVIEWHRGIVFAGNCCWLLRIVLVTNLNRN